MKTYKHIGYETKKERELEEIIERIDGLIII